MRFCTPTVALPLAVLATGCLYAGGGARTTFDTRSWEPTYSASGYLGAFVTREMDSPSFGSVTDYQGFAFALAAGAAYNQRLDRWEAVMGPRFGWLFPHGVAEFTFETRFAGEERPMFAFMWSFGPRVEVSRSYNDRRRTAHVLSLPAHVGFAVGDGFRPELGAGLDYHAYWWSPNARFH